MNSNMLYGTLKKLSKGKRKTPMYIYLDENDSKIKEIPLKDMAASALINGTMKQYRNPAKLIHDLMFGY